jgi:hypothetical protein
MANEAEVQKMIAAFLRSGLSAKDAAGVLAQEEKAAAAARKKREMDEFHKGLGLRNLIMFLIFAALFFAIIASGGPL